MLTFTEPVLSEHEGVVVVRDDLLVAGTKSRFLEPLFEDANEVVFASPCQGGGQISIAWVARELKKEATIVCAKRRVKHPRTLQAQALGARIIETANGRWSFVQSTAKSWAIGREHRAVVPFGLDYPDGRVRLVEIAGSLPIQPDEVWCAAGSGMLARALRATWPKAVVHAVAVGREIAQEEIPGARIHRYPLPFNKHAPNDPPFPSDPHYDSKAWAMCQRLRRKEGVVLFWNVIGPAPEPQA